MSILPSIAQIFQRHGYVETEDMGLRPYVEGKSYKYWELQYIIPAVLSTQAAWNRWWAKVSRLPHAFITKNPQGASEALEFVAMVSEKVATWVTLFPTRGFLVIKAWGSRDTLAQRFQAA